VIDTKLKVQMKSKGTAAAKKKNFRNMKKGHHMTPIAKVAISPKTGDKGETLYGSEGEKRKCYRKNKKSFDNDLQRGRTSRGGLGQV